MRRCDFSTAIEVFDDEATGERRYFTPPFQPMPQWGLSPQLWERLTQRWVVGRCARSRWHLGRHRLKPTNELVLIPPDD